MLIFIIFVVDLACSHEYFYPQKLMDTKVHLVGMADADYLVPKLYCRSADGMLDCKDPLSDIIAPNILAEVNKK